MFSGSNGAGFSPILAPIMTPDQLNPRNNATYDTQNAIKAKQDMLAAMLLERAQGGGANPAAAQLQQATNANQSMTAGTIAATKGINPALAARQAAMAGSGLQQQSAAQAATMNAQQQIAAQGSLGELYGTMGSQNLNQQQILQGAIANLNSSNVSNANQTNSAKAGVAAANTKGQWDAVGGILKGAGSAVAMAHGGVVHGPSSKVGQHLKMATGGRVQVVGAEGSPVPGKPAAKGDSLKNDKVKALLSPGEIVLPRSVTQSKDAPKKAAEFVAAMKNRGMKK